jgi:hypothetical protein
VLAELSRGTNAFTGSTKGKRSIAARPQGVYGRLRPGSRQHTSGGLRQQAWDYLGLPAAQHAHSSP